MAAIRITDRPPVRRRPSPPAEAPRLELPLPGPAFEHARPRQDAEATDEAKPERGLAIVDFYI